VCYKKGGYLAITDANLALGRILPETFPKIFGPREVCLQQSRSPIIAAAFGMHVQ
jgi:N-methylhydantoinase A/oxoprolinase/acetone carboxylase beta subunit